MLRNRCFAHHSRMLFGFGCASMFGRGSVSSARYSFCSLELQALPTMILRQQLVAQAQNASQSRRLLNVALLLRGPLRPAA
jgi:hypothetical protein